MLHWTHGADYCGASSCLHDEGSPFVYYFTREGSEWRNETDQELLYGPYVESFDSLANAKAWAETTERRWEKVDFSDAPSPTDDGDRSE